MHPPFFLSDVRVGHHDSLPPRRHAPSRLDIRPAPPGPLRAPMDPPPVAAGPVIWLVPQPRPTARDRFGRFLIRLGQRMILRHRPG